MPKITYPITSHQNPRIKNIVKLRNRRHRDKQKMMLIEGYRCLDRAWQNIDITELYICPELFQEKMKTN